MDICCLIINLKRLIMRKFIFLLFGLLLMLPLIAQVEAPESIVDVIGNIDLYMGSLFGIGFLSVWITGVLNGWIKVVKPWIRQAISWLVPVVITVVLGSILNFGFLAEKTWYIAAIYGVGAGLISNGIFDISFVKTAVKWIENLINKKKG